MNALCSTRPSLSLPGLALTTIFFTEAVRGETHSVPSWVPGTWAFHLADRRPVWLEIREGDQEGTWQSDLLWSVGHAKPVERTAWDSEKGEFQLHHSVRWKFFGKEPGRISISPLRLRPAPQGASGEVELIVRHQFDSSEQGSPPPETGDEILKLVGQRIPPPPPAPNLDEVKFGPPITLIAPDSLEGWRLEDPTKRNGWRVEQGVLINETPKTDHGAYGEYGNLMTTRDFEDFELTIEYQLPPGGNSGIYLRGYIEMQVMDREASRPDRGPGAIYARIAPTHNATKPAGEWNRCVLTLVDRHVTVSINGDVVIDNQLVRGCTGGGVNANCTSAGPIFLQGDHTSVRYRNAILRPVLR